MAQQPRRRSKMRSTQPKSLEALYNTSKNACESIQRNLNTICKHCESIHMDTEDGNVVKVLECIETFDSEVKLAMLSDDQCQLLAEDLNLDMPANVVVDALKSLRGLELLQNNVAAFFMNLNKRLSSVLDDGVYIFCASLVELAHEEVDEVNAYNDFAIKQRSELTEAVHEAKQHQDRWKNLNIDTKSALHNLADMKACLKDIQLNWKQINEKITEWIKQDREYPVSLTNHINRNRKKIEDLLSEIEMLKEKEEQKKDGRHRRRLQMEALHKRRRELCNSLGHIQRVKRFNSVKMGALNSESSQANCDGEQSNTTKPSFSGNGGNNTLNSSKSQEEFLRRRASKLDKEESDIKATLKNVNKRIGDLQRLINEDECQMDAAPRRISEINAEIVQMEKASADCREILLQRGKIQTFIQLQKGIVTKAAKGENLGHETSLNAMPM